MYETLQFTHMAIIHILYSGQSNGDVHTFKIGNTQQVPILIFKWKVRENIIVHDDYTIYTI